MRHAANLHDCTAVGRAVHPDDDRDARYNGPQDAGEPGAWLLLFTCHHCATTFAGYELADAARCIECWHLVLGDGEDPKTVLPEGTLCSDCAACDLRVPRQLHRPWPKRSTGQETRP